MKRIAVTGGSGFLGKWLVDRLRRQGVVVQSMSRRDGLDLADGQAVGRSLREFRADCVIHCAAHVGGIAYVRDHGPEVYRDNLKIGMGLIEGIIAAGTPNLINIMPNCTYPGAKEIYVESEWWDGPMHESVLMYGLPRKALWGYCWTWGQQKRLRSAHLVLPNLYGPGDHMDPVRSHALGAIVARVVQAQRKNCEEITLWGTGKAVREWLYVEDAAEAVAGFLDVFADPVAVADNSPVYNVGVGIGMSMTQLAESIKAAADWNGQFDFDPKQPDGAMKKVLDGTRFRNLTGWRPQMGLDEGIARTIGWYREELEKDDSACKSRSLIPA